MVRYFIHGFCDQELSQLAAAQTIGITFAEENRVYTKLVTEDPEAQKAYFEKYEVLFQTKYRYPSNYGPIASAPEHEELRVMWGDILNVFEFGWAKKVGDRWYQVRVKNPYANGRPCATPTAWRLPNE